MAASVLHIFYSVGILNGKTKLTPFSNLFFNPNVDFQNFKFLIEVAALIFQLILKFGMI